MLWEICVSNKFNGNILKINLMPIDCMDDSISKSYVQEPEFFRYCGNVNFFQKLRHNRRSQLIIRRRSSDLISSKKVIVLWVLFWQKINNYVLFCLKLDNNNGVHEQDIIGIFRYLIIAGVWQFKNQFHEFFWFNHFLYVYAPWFYKYYDILNEQ